MAFTATHAFLHSWYAKIDVASTIQSAILFS